MGAPLSLEELKESLQKIKNAKAPGKDGIQSELYLKSWDILGLLLLDMFDIAIQKGRF